MRGFLARLVAGTLALLIAGCAVSRDGETHAAGDTVATVGTSSGMLRGTVIEDGTVDLFQGVPYAAPPVGDLRWKAPRPPRPWSGVRDAKAPGSPCPQTGRLASHNEDCLTLNVWAPHQRPSNKLPVMVFIHGGGQRESAANEYRADWLVTRGTPVVYVGINYRLNIFAFFAHQALTAEEPALGSGNYAALDQIQALRWVRDNIAAFGGDPGNVTVFGESGGAQAVCVLLASPPARGLFHRAISQSGPCQWQFFPSLTASERRGADIAARLGCAQADPMPCLRALPASAVLDTERGAASVLDASAAQPAWGGGVMPLPMREAIASGQFARVPFMQGANRDEGMYHLSARHDASGKPLTADQYPDVLRQYLGASRVTAVRERYPLTEYPSPLRALAAALTDSGTVSNNRVGLCNFHLANQLAAPHVALYAYEFADRTAPYPSPIFNVPGDLPGAAHTKELSYLFHQQELTSAQRRISDTMIAYWTRFAAHGDPNVPGLPAWPVYTGDKQMVMTFEAGSVGANNGLKERAHCRFWSEQGFGNLSGPYPTPTQSGTDYK
ncbi:carboxylesterase/lipase family protein [Azohydromonas australica]|uniref:carboxylesterase/lipase family protein n=1 Tax=Azohydromonas australica TaxID=364039 RepID=UPI0003F6D164|nr:carboxylesterase family protein [Azohydromonas australica]